MTMRLQPGARPRDAASELERQAVAAANVLGIASTSEEMLRTYVRWAIEAERMLRGHFVAADVAEQLHTPRYWSLQGPMPGSRDVVPLQVEAEVADQCERLGRERARLTEGQSRWRTGCLLVPDTSALIHGPKLWEWDPAADLELRDAEVRIVLPILVMDELDGLKESSKQHTRHRARETLKWIAEKMGAFQWALIREGGIERSGDEVTRVRGDVYLDVFVDEPSHSRLPLADDEIVDRANFVASIAGRQVTLVTNDVGQAYRARRSGLKVFDVQDPIYDVDLQEAARAERQAAKEAQRREANAHRERR